MEQLAKLISLTEQLESTNSALLRADVRLMKKHISKMTDLELLDPTLGDDDLESGIRSLVLNMGDEIISIEKARLSREREKTKLELALDPLYDTLFTADDSVWRSYIAARMTASIKNMRGMMNLLDREANASTSPQSHDDLEIL